MSQQAVKSAIRRATLLAHRTMDRLDADTQAELRQMYQAAAKDLQERINAAGGADGNISLGLLRDILDQVKARLDALSRSRDNVLDNGLRDAAKFGVAPITAAGTGMHDAAVLDSVAAMQIADEAVRFVRGFVADDGLQLSDRIWRLDRHARETVTGAIELAVIQGHGAAQAARELLSRGQPVPADLADRLTAGNANALGNQVAGLMTGTGSPMSNALRLMRTEINRAHGEAYIAGALDHPDAAGIRFLLSPQHPEHDICDLHAEANLYGLGAGVYPDRQSCPWPAHPNTLSYTMVVFKDEITDADRAGKETVSEALSRMSPEQRQGVLGVNKAKAFDAGGLKKVSSLVRRIHPEKIDPSAMDITPERMPWNDFPEVAILAGESEVKSYPEYAAAKSGDISAARLLIMGTVTDVALSGIARGLGRSRPIVAAVEAIEERGNNVIPPALAGIIAQRFGLAVDDDIVQINRVSRTGTGGYYRLSTQPLFDGRVKKGAEYLLVDDFVGQGATLANLKGYIESRGGRVVLATTLTGKPFSAKIALSNETLIKLRDKHGSELEKWWKNTFGYGFDRLTESEARYLINSPDADTIRNRIVAEKQKSK